MPLLLLILFLLFPPPLSLVPYFFLLCFSTIPSSSPFFSSSSKHRYILAYHVVTDKIINWMFDAILMYVCIFWFCLCFAQHVDACNRLGCPILVGFCSRALFSHIIPLP
ncbi:unnamed protein product, partial [Musa textilis]